MVNEWKKDRGASAERAWGTFTVGIIVGIAAAIFGVYGLLDLMVERFGTNPPTDHIERISVHGGALYVEAGFADATTVWIRSMNGGATWEKVAEPAEVVVGQLDDETECAVDGVCYLAQLLRGEDAGDDPTVVQIRRMTTDGRWRAEAKFKRWDECDASTLSVDAANSDRAMVECTASTVAARTKAGTWPLRDVLEIARGLR